MPSQHIGSVRRSSSRLTFHADAMQCIDASAAPIRYGYTNPCFTTPAGQHLCAQGSFGSVAGNCSGNQSNTSKCFDDALMGCKKEAGRCIPSANANAGHAEYQAYLSDALANSWSRNLGIDGFIVDTSFQIPCAPGTNPDYGARGGTEYIFYNTIIGNVRQTQPQVVLSGEDCASWDDAIEHNFQLPGTKASGKYQLAMQNAVAAKDLDTVESVVALSGADAATVICYMHSGLDGRQPGACPTLYYRDVGPTYAAADVATYRMWVALEAASGILSEHQGSPTAVFGERRGSWNVTMDPAIDSEEESPLWAFSRSRALNRLALRTKLKVAASSAEGTAGVPAPAPRAATATAAAAAAAAAALANYSMYPQANCYNEGHGGTVLPGAATNQTAASCTALCTAMDACDCATFQARPGEPSQHRHVGGCWLRAHCQPSKFERDNLTRCYDVYVKKTPPPSPPPSPPPPSRSGGAIAYLKHDALGPDGDAAVVVFNPGPAQTLTIDLSALPAALLAAKFVPRDIFTNATARLPLSANWSVPMAAESFAAYGFTLGVFAPRKGKFKHCTAADGYSKPSPASTTLQECFLACHRDTHCHNVFITTDVLPRWLEKPGPIGCTLLGTVLSSSTACVDGGAGTLVAALAERTRL